MKYCVRCVYPENTKPYIIFGDDGLCSGCRTAALYTDVDWDVREKAFGELMERTKAQARENHSHYDCLIPVSGGKDSHYQAHIIKTKYGLNPLFVTYNHMFNAPLGVRNLRNLVNEFGCDLLRFTSSPEAVRKLSRYMLRKCGDVTWHYHCGILTFPIQTAVRYKIPLIIWGENNFYYSVGTFNPDDMVEFSRKHRKDFGLRGLEAEDAVGHDHIEWSDIGPFMYPSDEEIEEVGVRGIYLSNFFPWDDKSHAELVHEKYNFAFARAPRDRTFNLYAKLDDYHSNGVHDYLKYLKFGYGRATDDAAIMIREGRMTREEGIDAVQRHDHVRPRDLDIWLRYVGMREDEFYEIVDPQRDPEIWEKDEQGQWRTIDSVANHRGQSGVDDFRLPIKSGDHRFVEGKYVMEDPRWLLDYEDYVTF